MNKHIESFFPNLMASYSVTSPETKKYNCFAWAAGDSNKRWEPDPLYLYFWPANVPRRLTLDVFRELFESLNYNVCASAKREEGFEKVAIYVDSNGIPTHAARQLASGHWTSKLGDIEDIEHQTLEGLSGHTYGSVALIMKRRK